MERDIQKTCSFLIPLNSLLRVFTSAKVVFFAE